MSEPDDYSLKNSYELISVNSHSAQNNICIDYNNLPFAESVEQFFEDPSHFKPKPEFLSILFNENDDTILTHVVKMQNTDAVLALIKTGVDVNTPNRKGITPISAAAHKGNVSIMESLIRAGAHVNALNSSGSTALIQASHFGHSDAVSLLLKNKAISDFANSKGTTALMRASQEGHVSISKLLISAGADVNRKNNEGMNALMLASQRGHSDMALLLIKAGAAIDEQTSQGSTALMLACKRGHEKVVEVLVSMGAELYVRDSRHRCARDTAEKRHHYALLSILDTQVQISKIQEYRNLQRQYQFKELRKSYQQGKLRLNETSLRAIISLHEVNSRSERDSSDTLSAGPNKSIGKNKIIWKEISNMCKHSNYCDWQWPVLMLRCLELPMGIFELIMEMLPLPRIWHWSLWCLKRRCRLAPYVAITDSYIIIDEILADLNLFNSKNQSGLLVKLNNSPERRHFLKSVHGMNEALLDSLCLWSDLQSVISRCTDSDIAFKPTLARQVLSVAISLYKWHRHRACPIKALACLNSSNGNNVGSPMTYSSKKSQISDRDALEATDAGGEDDGSETAVDHDQDTETENPADIDNDMDEDGNDEDDLDSDVVDETIHTSVPINNNHNSIYIPGQLGFSPSGNVNFNSEFGNLF